MRILGVYMRNIRSYPDGVVVFPPDGVTVIYGPTGSGKTSVLMSISHALFGLPSGGKRDLFEAYEHPTGRDLLRAGSQEGCVRVLLSVGGKLYLVERRFRRLSEDRFESVSGLLEEYVIDRSTKGIVRVKSYNFASRTELDNKIAEIVGFKERISQTGGVRAVVFTSALYVPQFNVHEILEYTPEQRRDVIEKAFGLEKYKIARKNLAKLIEKVRIDLERLEGSIQVLQLQLNKLDKNQLNKRVTELRARLDSVENVIRELLSKVESKRDEARKIREKHGLLVEEKTRLEWALKEYESKYSQFKELEARARFKLRELGNLLNLNVNHESGTLSETLQIVIGTATDILNRLKQEETKLNDRLSDLKRELSTLLERERELIGNSARLLGQLEVEKKKLKDLQGELASRQKLVERGICPLCQQPISREHGEKIVVEISDNVKAVKAIVESITKEVERLEAYKRELESVISEKEEAISKLEQELKVLIEKANKLDKLVSELTDLTAQLAKHEEAVRSLRVEDLRKELNRVVGEIEDVKKNLALVESEIVELEKELDKARDQRSTLLAEIKGLEGKLAEVEKLEKELEEKARRKDRLRRLQEVLSNFSKVVDALEQEVARIVASEFKEEFAKYLRVLMEGQPIEATVTDDFGVTFRVLVDNKAYTAGSLSGGQSIALSLAYRLALNATVRKYSPNLKKSVLILDEPTTGFSPDLVARLRALLDDLSKSGLGQVIVVTHDETLMEVGDCRIRLELDPLKLETKVFYEECSVSGINFDEYRGLIESILRGRLRSALPNTTLQRS